MLQFLPIDKFNHLIHIIKSLVYILCRLTALCAICSALIMLNGGVTYLSFNVFCDVQLRCNLMLNGVTYLRFNLFCVMFN